MKNKTLAIELGDNVIGVQITDYSLTGKARPVNPETIKITREEDGTIRLPGRAPGLAGLVGSGWQPQVLIRKAENGNPTVALGSIIGESEPKELDGFKRKGVVAGTNSRTVDVFLLSTKAEQEISSRLEQISL